MFVLENIFAMVSVSISSRSGWQRLALTIDFSHFVIALEQYYGPRVKYTRPRRHSLANKYWMVDPIIRCVTQLSSWGGWWWRAAISPQSSSNPMDVKEETRQNKTLGSIQSLSCNGRCFCKFFGKSTRWIPIGGGEGGGGRGGYCRI